MVPKRVDVSCQRLVLVYYTREYNFTRNNRGMDSAIAFLSSDHDLVRFHQLKLQIVKPGYGTVLYHDGSRK